jgi:hypothetical protein
MVTWLVLLVAGPAAWAAPTLRTTPDPIMLEGAPSTVRLELRGVPGHGAPRAAVNVGTLEGVTEEGGAVVLRVRTPVERHPQQLAAIVWRPGAGFHLVRVPMLGRTVVPVRTRRASTVTISVGGRDFGPHSSKAGRLSVPVLVRPGVTEARVKVIDSFGLASEKRIAIAAPAYNLLALALDRSTRELALASAEPARGLPSLEVNGRAVQPRSLAPGLWSVVLPDEARVVARAWLPGHPLSTLRLEAELHAPPPAAAPPVAGGDTPDVETVRRSATGERRWAGVVGVGVGFAHNIGALVTPRFTVSLGLELRLAVGWLGLRGLAGVSWGGHSEPSGVGEASSKVVLVPIGAALTYRVPFRVLTPYLAAGCLAQLVRTQNQLEGEERLRHDLALTVLALLGAERELGAGLIFLESGYQWSRLENEDVQLLAGGLVLEAGYRFRF